MKTILIFGIFIFLQSCTLMPFVSVHEDRSFMGSSTYYAKGHGVSVSYYNGQCCCVAYKVLQNLADSANKGEFDWKQMEYPAFQKQKLDEECKKIRER